MNTKRLIILALGCVMALPAYLAAQDSVVDAAKKAQAEKKSAPKAKLVIDNDNLDTLKGTINVVGQEPAATDGANKAAASGDKPAKDMQKASASAEKTPAKDEAYWRQRFADANKKLADDAHELDILQRELNLKQEQYYTDPMASLKQQYSRQDINDSRAKIDQKTAAVAQDKQDIANLEDELRQSGGDPGWASPPSSAPAPSSTAASTSPVQQ
jgi:chromosome segregation ATPase